MSGRLCNVTPQHGRNQPLTGDRADELAAPVPFPVIEMKLIEARWNQLLVNVCRTGWMLAQVLDRWSLG